MPIIDNILQVIRGYRHRDYERTCDIAAWSYSMMTGENQDTILLKFRTKESEAQQEQRLAVTSSKTQFAAGKIARYFNEVHRSDTVVNELYFNDDVTGIKLDFLRSGLDSFSEGKGLKEYLDEEYFFRNWYDPNSALILEWELSENNKPQPYALNVRAEDILDFYIKRGNMQYIVIRTCMYYKKPGDYVEPAIYANPNAYLNPSEATQRMYYEEIPGYEMKYKYTVYGKGETIELLELPAQGIFNAEDYPDFTPVTIHVKNRDVSFFMRELKQNIDFCPAIRYGYFRDPQTDGRTFVNPLYPGTKICDDLIRNKSEYDLTKSLHGFLQKFIYVSKCKKCYGTGWLGKQGEERVQCGTCRGQGKMSHYSVQDIIEIVMPDDATQIIDLSRMVYYAQIQEFVPRMQSEDVDRSVKDLFSAVFNENLFERSEVAVTATENKLNYRSVYNALHPYSEGYAKTYKRVINYISQILEIEGELINNFAMTKDYNMETVDELLDQLNKASGAPKDIRYQIEQKILLKQHQNDPTFLDEYEAIENLKPLGDKAINEILVIIAQLPADAKLKVQWIYFKDIILELKNENPDIFSLPYKVQKKAFDAKTTEFQLRLQEETTETIAIL